MLFSEFLANGRPLCRPPIDLCCQTCKLLSEEGDAHEKIVFMLFMILLVVLVGCNLQVLKHAHLLVRLHSGS